MIVRRLVDLSDAAFGLNPTYVQDITKCRSDSAAMLRVQQVSATDGITMIRGCTHLNHPIISGALNVSSALATPTTSTLALAYHLGDVASLREQ